MPAGCVNYFTTSFNLFQLNGVKNLTSTMHTFKETTRKVTARMNESTTHARTTVKSVLLLPVRMVLGLGLRTVQVRTHSDNKYSLKDD